MLCLGDHTKPGCWAFFGFEGFGFVVLWFSVLSSGFQGIRFKMLCLRALGFAELLETRPLGFACPCTHAGTTCPKTLLQLSWLPGGWRLHRFSVISDVQHRDRIESCSDFCGPALSWAGACSWTPLSSVSTLRFLIPDTISIIINCQEL